MPAPAARATVAPDEDAPAPRLSPVEIAAAIALLLVGAWLRWRVVHGWVFAGSDSYGYVKLADELRLHHRYALSPTDPPHFGRMPLYPILIAVAKGAAPATMNGGDGWARLTLAQAGAETLVTLPLVFLMARRMAGRAAGLVALALAALCPFTSLYAGAALTESFATTLTTATLAPLVLLRGRRWRLGFALGGALCGLSTLLRPDGVFLAVAFLPAAIALRDRAAGGLDARSLARRWRTPAVALALALAGFAATYGAWPLRNLATFRRAYPVGFRVDRYTRPLPESYMGYWRWLTTWGRDSVPQSAPSTCFYNPPCAPTVDDFPAEAYEDAAERQRVQRLLDRRRSEGLSDGVAAEFSRLADEKARRHPLTVWLVRPAERALHMFVSPFDELLQNPRWRPWPSVTARIMGRFRSLTKLLLVGTVLAGALLLLARATRRDALVLLAPIAVRTVVLTYTLYTMPRYTVEAMPLDVVLIAAAAATVVRMIVATIARRVRRSRAT